MARQSRETNGCSGISQKHQEIFQIKILQYSKAIYEKHIYQLT